jgi:DNA-binding transcriptional regulator YiaG
MRKIEVKLKTGQTIQVLPGEVQGLREAGLLLEEDPDKSVEQNEPEQKKKPGYKLPVLTQGEKKARIKQAQRLKKQGYSQREIARQLGVSHVAVGKWLKKEKTSW